MMILSQTGSKIGRNFVHEAVHFEAFIMVARKIGRNFVHEAVHFEAFIVVARKIGRNFVHEPVYVEALYNGCYLLFICGVSFTI
jgi:hypothetical protein